MVPVTTGPGRAAGIRPSGGEAHRPSSPPHKSIAGALVSLWAHRGRVGVAVDAARSGTAARRENSDPVARVLPFRDPATQALASDRRQRAAAPGLSVGVVIEDTVAYALLQGMKSSRGAISPVLAERGLHPGQDLMPSALWRDDGIT